MLFSYRKHIPLKGNYEATWKKEWGATLFCSHGANNARGVAILIRNNFDCTVEESIVDSDGRFIILKASISGDPTLLVNIYAPNRDNELVTFYRSLLPTMQQIIWTKLKILLWVETSTVL